MGREEFPAMGRRRGARLRVELSPVGGHLPGDEAALVAPGPLKQHIDHEIDSKNAKSKEYGQGHRCRARTGGSCLHWRQDRGAGFEKS